MAKVEGQRENGPATRASSTHSAARRQSRLARPRRRTIEDILGSPSLARLLEVLEELRRTVSCTDARPHNYLACRTAFEQTSRMRGLARECRKWAAPWAWQFDCIVVRTYQGGLRRGCRKFRRTRVAQATIIATAAERAPRARGLVSSSRVPLQQPREYTVDRTAHRFPSRTRACEKGSQDFWTHPRGALERGASPMPVSSVTQKLADLPTRTIP